MVTVETLWGAGATQTPVEGGSPSAPSGEAENWEVKSAPGGKWKVVDVDSGDTISSGFSSPGNAQYYIEYHKTKAGNPSNVAPDQYVPTNTLPGNSGVPPKTYRTAIYTTKLCTN